MATLKEVISCLSDYDPDALPVAKANEVIRSFIDPVSGVEKLRVRAALGRVLAKDVVSPIDVPSHDNSAMDGYAVRNDDLGAGEPVTLTEIGTAYAGREFAGEVGRGRCVRVMTGAVMPKNTGTVIIQEAVTVEGGRISIPPGQEPGQNRRLGGEVIDLGVVRDDPKKLEAAFRKAAASADAVVTSGGVSVGEADFTKQMMAKLGEVVFWKIAMRPGRPMAFGRIRARGKSAYLFGLPGNPVAVMVTFYHFVRGALLTMMGRCDTDLPLLRAKAETSMRKKPGRTEYQRGILELKNGEWSVRLTGAQGSGILRSMSEANCFVVLGHEQGAVKAGDYVEVMVMDGLV